VGFVVALRAEAEPFVCELGLERSSEAGPFPVYLGDGVGLVVSGVGKVRAAAATLHLHRRLGEPAVAGWINVGIAGHRRHAVGEGVLAHKVTDAGTGRSWYPPLVFARSAPSCEVVTVEEVERTYPGDAAYEMEAAGFVAAASRLQSAELVQVFKVISDNAACPVEGIDRRRIREWIEGRLPEIEALRAAVQALAAELTQDAVGEGALGGFLERWHFTSSERHRLRRLLERLQAVGAAGDPEAARWRDLRTAREVLQAMELGIEERYLAAPLDRAESR
jgi:hypothetical protein